LKLLLPTFAAVTVAVSVAQPVAAQVPQHPWMNRALAPEQRADLLIDAMRLDEKLQQIYNFPVYNEDLDDGDPDNGIGCDYQRVGRHIEGIPALEIPTFRFANGGTGIRGGDCLPEPVATGLPAQVAGAAAFNPDVMFQWGKVLDNEIHAWAHQSLWGPAFNMARTPFGGRNQEYMGEDPYLAGVTATAQVKGIQATKRTHATIKHFAANESEYQQERWTAASRVPSRAMHELYLLPFEMSIRDGKAASVMCAFPHLNFDWACENIPLMQQTLRQRWGFDGYVVSDRRATHSTVQSILAGNDLELDFEPDFYTRERIMAALNAGQITEADIDALLRGRYVKMFEFGQFDNPLTRIDFSTIDRQGNNNVARRAADESITLLKNENRRLPLNPVTSGDIAVIGAQWFAGQATLPPRGSDQSRLDPQLDNVITDPALTVNPRDGIVNTLRNLNQSNPGSRVTFTDGDVIAEAVEAAEAADTVILFAGDNPRETRDRDTLLLPSAEGTNQELLMERVLEARPDTIVVLKTQGMILMPWLDDALAVVEAWYPGQQDGNAVADVLFGVTNPSGKLPVTFGNTDHEAAYSSTAQYPGLREDNGLGGAGPFEGPAGLPQLVTHYTEGLEMGYRWYQANNVKPVFPFGHGLSYTTFDYSDLSLDVQRGTGNRTVVNVSYTIKNTGLRQGKEASQVYLDLPQVANEPPKRLVGFQKVDLRPGRSTRATVTIDSAASNHPLSYFAPTNPQDLLEWANGDWVTPNGTFRVHVGGSSEDTPLSRSFELAPAAAPPAPQSQGGQAAPQPDRAQSNASAPSVQAAGKIALKGSSLRSTRSRVITVRVRCPLSIGARGCRGTLTATRGRVRIARTRVALPAGRTSTVKLTLTRKAYRQLLDRGRLSVRLELRAKTPGAKVQRTVKRVSVSAPRNR
jgi:beta-glucosidase